MRNTIKVDEAKTGSGFGPRSDNAAQMRQDAGLDEWMGKPQKVPLDIIDTQKFAEIVRQKHGNKTKEEEKKVLEKIQPSPETATRPSPVHHKDRDRGDLRDSLRKEEPSGRRHEKVEMQISSRENRERDLREGQGRDRYRDNRGGRRR
jgi:hypothetical protein